MPVVRPESIQNHIVAKMENLSLPEQETQDSMVLEVPQVGPGSAPTVFRALLRAHLARPDTLVRLRRLILEALVGPKAHFWNQIRSRSLIFFASESDI